MKEEISIGGYYEGGERYHAEAVGEIEGRVPWASTHIHCITHLVVRMRISMPMMAKMMIVRMIMQYKRYVFQARQKLTSKSKMFRYICHTLLKNSNYFCCDFLFKI